jgi:hypothetical protein
MGSGYHASLGWPFAAYQRNPKVQTTPFAVVGLRDHVISPTAEDSTMYDIQASAPTAGFKGFFFGGSGLGQPSIRVYPNWW